MELATIFGGVIVSFLAQILKNKVGSRPLLTMGIVISLSILGGIAYTYLSSMGYWESFMGILATAGATYAYVIKNYGDFVKGE